MLHAVHLPALLVLATDPPRRHGRLGAVRSRRQLQKLVRRLGNGVLLLQDGLAHISDEESLVVRVFVERSRHVAMRERGRGAGQTEFDFRVVELFFGVFAHLVSVKE